MDWFPLLALTLFLLAILLLGSLLWLLARRALHRLASLLNPRPSQTKALSVHIVGQVKTNAASHRRWQWGELTERETEIARLAMEGKSDRLIANELGIAVRTVTTHMQNIFRKLDIRSRHEIKHRCQDFDE